MEQSIRLGRIAGVKVGMNWTLLVISTLIAWALAGHSLPSRFPGHDAGVYWTIGVASSVIFFACLLAHEMGHALVARREGVEVEDVTLWLFGGVARLKGDALTAGSELRIALVGPIVSLVIAAFFFLVSVGLDAGGHSPILVGMPEWLARINAVLALFNLAPAFPLDGGRVLRAMLWRRRGRVRATVTASRAGRIFAFGMMGFGAGQFIFSSDTGGLWLVFLGWFLLSAARSEETRVRWREILEGVPLHKVMSRDPLVVPEWMTLQAFIDSHLQNNQQSTFVMHDLGGSVSGIVTIEKMSKIKPWQRGSVRLRDLGCPKDEVPVAAPDDMLLDLLGKPSGCAAGRAFVFENGELVGVVTPGDVERILQNPALLGST